MDLSAVTTTANTLTQQSEADLRRRWACGNSSSRGVSDFVGHSATWISRPGEASPVAAVLAATALVDAVTQPRGVDSSVATTAQRQVAAAISITSTSPSVAASFAAAGHAATALVNMVSQPYELNSSTATIATFAASETKQDVDERHQSLVLYGACSSDSWYYGGSKHLTTRNYHP